jgi:hypothetical protein
MIIPSPEEIIEFRSQLRKLGFYLDHCRDHLNEIEIELNFHWKHVSDYEKLHEKTEV